MAMESSEGKEDAKLMGGNQLLVIDDDLREMGKKAAWSVSSCKAGNGVCLSVTTILTPTGNPTVCSLIW
ncbi:hypothetical protein FF1_026065 [Malus domestica]